MIKTRAACAARSEAGDNATTSGKITPEFEVEVLPRRYVDRHAMR